MKLLSRPDRLAVAAFFLLLANTVSGGALALPVFLSLAGAIAIRPSLLRQVIENKPTTLLLLLVFTAWATLSSAWYASDDHSQAPKLAALIPLGAMFVAAATADVDTRRLTEAAGLASFIALMPLMAVEAIWNLPLNRIAQPDVHIDELAQHARRAITVILAISWGAAGGLLAGGGRIRAVAAAAVLAATAWMSLQFDMEALTIGFALGLAAFAAAFARPQLVLYAVTGGVAVWMLAAPFATPLLIANQPIEELPASWAARAQIWQYICGRIGEAPLFGHGLDASRLMPDQVPLHPHSASLQIWYELGAVGAMLAAAVLIIGGRALARAFSDNRAAAAAASGTLAAVGLVANVSFGLWQEWWIATMFVAAALVGAVSIKGAK